MDDKLKSSGHVKDQITKAMIKYYLPNANI